MGQSLLIIKPNAVADNNIGAIISILEKKGLAIKNMKMDTFTKERAEGFYEIHRGKPFYEKLVAFMTSGPIVQLSLEHENCVEYVREIIGATDPANAAEGTIRKLYAKSLTENAVHASDSDENAEIEISYIFNV
ncbi:nucleoside-diphosphate kinase [Candidatus Latescibacterota bacterium]